MAKRGMVDALSAALRAPAEGPCVRLVEYPASQFREEAGARDLLHLWEVAHWGDAALTATTP